MKAVIYRDNGGPEVLELLDREPAAPGPGEVRVRVAVSGVNPTDWKTRSGATNPKLYAEVTPGLDGAGVIDAVGPGEDRARIGERVWLFLAGAGRQFGTVAEAGGVPPHPAGPPPPRASFHPRAAPRGPPPPPHPPPHPACPRSPRPARSPGPRAGRAGCVPGRSTARWCSSRAAPGRSGTRRSSWPAGPAPPCSPRSAARRRPGWPPPPAPTTCSTTA